MPHLNSFRNRISNRRLHFVVRITLGSTNPGTADTTAPRFLLYASTQALPLWTEFRRPADEY